MTTWSLAVAANDAQIDQSPVITMTMCLSLYLSPLSFYVCAYLFRLDKVGAFYRLSQPDNGDWELQNRMIYADVCPVKTLHIILVPNYSSLCCSAFSLGQY